MPHCSSCKSEFPNHQIINGKRRNLQRRKFCPECSPFGTHNTRHFIPDKTISGYKICCTCKKSKELSEFYFSNKAHTTLRYDCKTCANSKVIEWQRELKQKCVDLLGGKCVVCGYSNSAWGFDFHHTIPSEKEFQFSNGRSKKFEAMEKELKKCILVCATCHREIHAGLHPQYLIVKEHL